MATFVRAYADIAQNLTEAGYSDAEVAALQKEVEFYSDTRAAIKKHSGEELDIKPYEADMRHLLNTYIQADPRGGYGQPEFALAHGTDHRDRHPRCHRPEAEREGQALEERHRRGHHQQRPQDDHPRPAHRPKVLRGDVQAAG